LYRVQESTYKYPANRFHSAFDCKFTSAGFLSYAHVQVSRDIQISNKDRVGRIVLPAHAGQPAATITARTGDKIAGVTGRCRRPS
jgi:hypothetical protein